jgi:hypothetical protein
MAWQLGFSFFFFPPPPRLNVYSSKIELSAKTFVCFTLQFLFCLSWRVRSLCYGGCVGNEVIEMLVLESMHALAKL